MVELEIEEVAIGDFNPDHGTVKAIQKQNDDIQLTFVNGDTITQPIGSTLAIDQGGRFSHGPTRPASREDLGGAGPL